MHPFSAGDPALCGGACSLGENFPQIIRSIDTLAGGGSHIWILHAITESVRKGVRIHEACPALRGIGYTPVAAFLGRRPMFEERRWGSYRVLDYQTLDDGSEFLTKRLRIRAGKNLSYQYHMQRSEIWTVIAGRGELVLDGRFIPMKPGDVAHIPLGQSMPSGPSLSWRLSRYSSVPG